MKSSASPSPGAASGDISPETAPAPPASAPASLPAENRQPAAALRHDAPFPAPAPRGGAAGWALLLALLCLGATAYTLWQSREWQAENRVSHEKLGWRLEHNDAAAAEARDLTRQVAALQGKLDAIEAKIDKSEGQTMALENLYQQFSRSQEDRLIAEVRQAVTIASQQLQYAGNVETALIALRGAQARLEQNDHGQFASLRRTLAADIEKLGQQGALDIPGIALRLEQLLAKVDTLPLVRSSEIPVPPPPEPTGAEDASFAGFARSLLRDIWNDLRSLIKIERLDAETEPVLLAPEQSAFLRENLKIRLLTARLALLARDGRTYAADLAQARNWIERFFDMHDPDVKAAVDGLHALEAMPVSVTRYELIESLAALRSLETPRGRAGAAAANPPAEAPTTNLPAEAPAAAQP
ncbi:MAG: uroporphyrinogen-III C-methyltransferase [Azoarcus sp.]|jgi:uroporphyrin-3 C-methyltransferase|nr:uroporphyrinogen-III C-methyltransferase [Azoarcus sp.]